MNKTYKTVQEIESIKFAGNFHNDGALFEKLDATTRDENLDKTVRQEAVNAIGRGMGDDTFTSLSDYLTAM